jgi:hypothetical protein
MKYKYSEQAKVLMDEMNLDEDELQEWFASQLVIGSQSILQFLLFKKNKK